jgi:homocysteine S-methyltransferase
MPALATSPTRFGASANGFSHIADEFTPGSVATVLDRRRDLDPVAYADIAMGWVDQGATIVGGCCEIGPEHIAELRRRLDTSR